LAFLDDLGQRGLLDRATLDKAVAHIASALYRVSPAPESAVLKLTAADGAAELSALLADVGDVDALIARYLSQWEVLAASGQQDVIWLQLGVAQAVHRPDPVARSVASPPSAQSHGRARPAATEPVVFERPIGVAVVCVIQIIAGIITTIVYLIGLAALLSYQPPVGSVVLEGVSLLLVVGPIVLAFFVFNGSSVARGIFTVLVALNLVSDLINIFPNPDWSHGLNMGLSIVYLVVLYSASANDYFSQTRR